MILAIFVCTLLVKTVATQTITVTLGTSQPVFGNEIKLICTVSSGCCSGFDRIWETGSGSSILFNGVSVNPSKYVEEYDSGTTGFNLIIKNLELSDIGKTFNCLFKLGTGSYTLVQDNSFQYIANEITCPFKEYQGKRLAGELKLSRAAPKPTFTANYGDANLTAVLVSTYTNYDTWFYIVTLSIDTSSTCGDDIVDERLTLIMKTGTTTRKLCDGLNLCEAGVCGLKNFGYCLILSVIAFVILLIVIFIRPCHTKETDLPVHSGGSSCKEKAIKLLIFGLVFAICAATALAIGIKIVNCLCGTDPVFIVLGLLTFDVPTGVICHKKCKHDKGLFFTLYFLLFGQHIILALTGGLFLFYLLYLLYRKTVNEEKWYQVLCIISVGLCCLLCKEPGPQLAQPANDVALSEASSKLDDGKVYEPVRQDSSDSPQLGQ